MNVIVIAVAVVAILVWRRWWRAVVGVVSGIAGTVVGDMVATAVSPPNSAEGFPGLGDLVIGGAIGFVVGVAAGLVAFTAIERARARSR